jgi:hypothetical protein
MMARLVRGMLVVYDAKLMKVDWSSVSDFFVNVCLRRMCSFFGGGVVLVC